MLNSRPTISSERAYLFTQYLRQHENEPMKERMAKAFAYVLDNMTIQIQPSELIVGNMGPTPRSCQIFPEYSWTWIEKELDRFDKRRTEKFDLRPEDKERLREVFRYWRGKSTAEICSQTMPEDSQRAAQAGLFTIGAPGTGIGHVIVDYRKVIQTGLESVLEQVTRLRRQVRNSPEKTSFYNAAEVEINAIDRFARRFSDLAAKMANGEKEPQRKKELQEISKVCSRVPMKPASSFQEALQSFWFVQLLVQTEGNGHSISTGRFDQYLYPYYAADIKSGKLTRDQALELLEMLWLKFSSVIKLRDEYYSVAFAGYPMFQNLTIGGQDDRGNDACNEVTYLALEATMNMRVTQPTVSFRWHDKTPKTAKLKVVEVVSRGLGMPGLFNDEVIVPMMKKKGVEAKEAFDYSILGCVEPIIEGEADVRPNIGFVNFAKVLEITLNNGKDPKTGTKVGVETGDPRTFKSYDELWAAYREQLDYTVDLLTKADRVAAKVHAKLAPTSFISSLLTGCVETGRAMQEGGAKYNAGGIQGVGIAIATDSLSVLRKQVFETKKMKMEQILNALSKNYEGFEDLRTRFENDPNKYGNDIEHVDLIAREIGKAFCESVQSRMTTRNGPYHAALFSVSMYIPQGESVGATPDGRRAGVMLSDGVSPAHNRDVHGPTAAMKSVARLDHGLCYNGTLYNMKFSPQVFSSAAGRDIFVGLVDAYFKLGGLHVQFNVLSRETLEDAKVHPLQHRDLIVRVAGYSAYFIELDPFVQDEVIARTEFSSAVA
jgi:formate C-acetyltransferase